MWCTCQSAAVLKRKFPLWTMRQMLLKPTKNTTLLQILFLLRKVLPDYFSFLLKIYLTDFQRKLNISPPTHNCFIGMVQAYFTGLFCWGPGSLSLFLGQRLHFKPQLPSKCMPLTRQQTIKCQSKSAGALVCDWANKHIWGIQWYCCSSGTSDNP